MKCVCSWCGLVLREGPEPITHSICWYCSYVHFMRKFIENHRAEKRVIGLRLTTLRRLYDCEKMEPGNGGDVKEQGPIQQPRIQAEA